jgi:DNA (cytosine-5)-methyltransferase 1
MPVECERLQGFPVDWTLPESDEFGDTDRIDTLRYNALGNAVTVPVAEWLARRIKAYLSKAEEARVVQNEREQALAVFA